jgi:hypothetical protein
VVAQGRGCAVVRRRGAADAESAGQKLDELQRTAMGWAGDETRMLRRPRSMICACGAV